MRYLSRGKENTHVQFPPKPAYLPVKCLEDNDSTEEESLQILVQAKCPSLFEPFRPPWWLPNGHFQTLYNVLGRLAHIDCLSYRRQLLQITDGGTIGLDFAPTTFGEMADDIPIVVVAHGLTGGSYESYLRAIIKPAVTPINEGGLGYRAVVITYRGCAGVPLTSPKLYTAGHTDDFRLCLAYIQHLYPRARLLGVGFSLGANIITRYLAEEGKKSRLCSAVVLSCPWNLEDNAESMMKTFLGKHIYSRGLGTSLQSIIRRHEKVLRRFPDNPIYNQIEATLALRNPMLHVFDDTFTRKVCGESPLFPMPTANHYYRWASTHHLVKDICVPYLSINSDDDPVVTSAPTESGKNEFVIMAITKGGGHLGWFESYTPWSQKVERWTTKPVLEWLKLMDEVIMFENTSTQATPVYKDHAGFVREHGKIELGCREATLAVPQWP